MEKWRINLFGGLKLTSAKGRPLASKSERLKVLIAFLAASHGPVERKSLAHALFQAEELPGLPNLCLLLSRSQVALQKLDPLPLIRASSTHLELIEENVEIDTVAFESLVRRARLESEPVRASCLWLEALDLASEKPLSNLDDPLLEPIRARLCADVLDVLCEIARGPYGHEFAARLLAYVRTYEFERHLDSLTLERVLNLYADLGLKEELVRSFTEYEAYLDDEFGESPSPDLVEVFEGLLSRLEGPKQSGPRRQLPERPELTVGREDLLCGWVDRLCTGDVSRLNTITGQSGIGKSHLIRELCSRLPKNISWEYFDLESMPNDIAYKVISSRPTSLLFLDHTRETHHDLIQRLLGDNTSLRIVRSGHSKMGYGGEQVVIIGSLDEDAAIELLKRNIALVSTSSVSPKAEQIKRLAHLCDGIPLALEIAGRLAGSIGLGASIEALERNLSGLSTGRGKEGRGSSLQNAVESSFANLGDFAKRIVRTLARFNGACYIDQILVCADVLPSDLEGSILAGLVMRDAERSYVRVSSSTASFVNGLVGDEREVIAFCTRSVTWFENRSHEAPIELQIADSLPMAVSIANLLLREDLKSEAVRLIGSIRPWLGSCALGSETLDPVVDVLLGSETEVNETWAMAVMCVSAAYFHDAMYDQMERFLASANARKGWDRLSSDDRCQLTMLEGLAQRGFGRNDRAVVLYQKAVSLADSSVAHSTLVRCYYNLGLLYESEERLAEALRAQESAAEHFDMETDPRVETLVNTCIGRLRYRIGDDLLGASLILEATLAHAAQRGDRRSMAEVLQNLGLVCYERGLFLRAASAEATGSMIMLEFGYTHSFRYLARSSFVTLAASFFEMGEDALGSSTRAMVDRLGTNELYAPNKVIFAKLEERTYTSPTNLRLSTVREEGVRDHLNQCLAVLMDRGAGSRDVTDMLRYLNLESVGAVAAERTAQAVRG